MQLICGVNLEFGAHVMGYCGIYVKGRFFLLIMIVS